jgi:hypothetical protein
MTVILKIKAHWIALAPTKRQENAFDESVGN